MRSRPQFFIDLERELAGESVEEPLVREDAEIRVQALQELWQGQAARCAQVDRLRGIENRTATGAMIAANQYWEQAQMMAQDPYGQRAYMAQQQAFADPANRMGPIWNSLGSFGGLFGGR